MARRSDIGKWGEDIAVDVLVKEGFAICERNWRQGHHEIDIVAMRGDTLAIVEVKTRTDKDEDPFESIDKKKISNLVAAAEVYINAKDCPHNVRFDVIGVLGTPADYTVEYIPDAFEPPMRFL